MRTVSGLFAALLLSFAAVGCMPTRSEFSSFAQAGTGYAVAVDKLLVAAAAAQVDSTSWTLILEKQTTDVNEAICKKIYIQKNEADIKRLEQISRLRRQARLLGQYFGLLEALATSDTPDRTKKALDGIVTQMGKIEKDLPPAVTALPEIGKVAVDLKIRAALREELNNRQEFIRAQLEIQERLLKELTGQIKHALELSRESQEQILVIKPMVSGEGLKNPENWVSVRHKILLTPLTIEELESASSAATKLREAFEGLISGEITTGRIDALITDINGLLSIAETIKS